MLSLGFDPDKVIRYEVTHSPECEMGCCGDTYPSEHGGYVSAEDFDAARERIAYLELENANLLRTVTDLGLRRREEKLTADLEAMR